MFNAVQPHQRLATQSEVEIGISAMSASPLTVKQHSRHQQPPRQPTPRDRKPGSKETKQNALKKRHFKCATTVVNKRSFCQAVSIRG